MADEDGDDEEEEYVESSSRASYLRFSNPLMADDFTDLGWWYWWVSDAGCRNGAHSPVCGEDEE